MSILKIVILILMVVVLLSELLLIAITSNELRATINHIRKCKRKDNTGLRRVEVFKYGMVVCTRNALDIGIVSQAEGGKALEILAKPYTITEKLLEISKPQYNVNTELEWLDTGYRMDVSTWNRVFSDMSTERFYKYWRERIDKK